ncbi:hypothetical protein ACFOU2_20725 [Bacillus songklensis]|uniref:Uncharacterized protein n=1 Tax=Bacillus songklensis TaxID=1069116 RepID=A0ABV8B8P9_9BACI
MKKEQNNESFRLSYESDDKMGMKEKTNDSDVQETEFFNTTQSSE